MATVATPFFGVPDGQVYPRWFEAGEDVTGDLAEVARAEGWLADGAETVPAAPIEPDAPVEPETPVESDETEPAPADPVEAEAPAAPVEPEIPTAPAAPRRPQRNRS